MSAVDAIGLGLELLLEHCFHLSSHRHSLRGLGILDIFPAKTLVLLDGSLQHPAMRQANGQTLNGHRVLRGHKLAVDSEATLAIELLADHKVALGGSHDISGPGLGLASGLATAYDGRD